MDLKFNTLLFLCILISTSIHSQSYSFTTYTDTYKQGNKQGETVKSTYVIDGENYAISSYMNGIRVVTNVIDQVQRKMTMITYSGENVQGFQVDLPHTDSIQIDSYKQVNKETAIQLIATDEVKNADGYTCRRYEMETPDAFLEVWMLEGHEIDFLGLFADMPKGIPDGQGKITPTMMQIPLEKGFPMEMYYEPTKNKLPATLTRVADLVIGNVDPSIFDVSEVPMIEIPKQQ